MTGQTLAVDWIRCEGHGLCAELLPEAVELDEWGYPIVDPRPLPRGLLPMARRAVEMCPTLALRLAAAKAAASTDRPAPVPPRAAQRRPDGYA